MPPFSAAGEPHPLHSTSVKTTMALRRVWGAVWGTAERDRAAHGGRPHSLSFGAVAVHAAVGGLPAGLAGHPVAHLHGQARFCAPLHRAPQLLAAGFCTDRGQKGVTAGSSPPAERKEQPALRGPQRKRTAPTQRALTQERERKGVPHNASVSGMNVFSKPPSTKGHCLISI